MQSTDAPWCCSIQFPFKATNFCQLRRKPTKTGGKASVHSVSASLIPMVREKQMSQVSAVYPIVGKIYLHESCDATLLSAGKQRWVGNGELRHGCLLVRPDCRSGQIKNLDIAVSRDRNTISLLSHSLNLDCFLPCKGLSPCLRMYPLYAYSSHSSEDCISDYITTLIKSSNGYSTTTLAQLPKLSINCLFHIPVAPSLPFSILHVKLYFLSKSTCLQIPQLVSSTIGRSKYFICPFFLPTSIISGI